MPKTSRDLIAAIEIYRAAPSHKTTTTLNTVLDLVAQKLGIANLEERRDAVAATLPLLIETANKSESTYLAEGGEPSEAAMTAADTAASVVEEHFCNISAAQRRLTPDETAAAEHDALGGTIPHLSSVQDFISRVGISPTRIIGAGGSTAVLRWEAGDKTFFHKWVNVKIDNIGWSIQSDNAPDGTKEQVVSAEQAERRVKEFGYKFLTARATPFTETIVLRRILSQSAADSLSGDEDDVVRTNFLAIWDAYRRGEYLPQITPLGFEIGNAACEAVMKGCAEDEEFGAIRDIRLSILASATCVAQKRAKDSTLGTVGEVVDWVFASGTAIPKYRNKQSPTSVTPEDILTIFALDEANTAQAPSLKI